MKLEDNKYTKTTIRKKENVIPQVRTITRYGTKSVILFNYAESPIETILEGDSEQANSHDTFLSRFVQLFGMTLMTRK